MNPTNDLENETVPESDTKNVVEKDLLSAISETLQEHIRQSSEETDSPAEKDEVPSLTGDLIPHQVRKEISEKIQELIEKKDQNTWKCKSCWRTTTRKWSLISHLETHLNLTLQCPQCDHTARTRKALRDHYSISHKM